MSLDVTAEVHVDREPAAVAAYMTDPGNDPEWIGGLREARLLGAPPVAVGSRVHRVASFLGRRVEYVNEILALDASHLDMASVQAPFPMRITYSFGPRRGGGTTVRNRVRGGRRGPLFALIGPLVRRNVQRDLERLKAILDPPREFSTMRGEERRRRAIGRRPGLDEAAVRPLLEQVLAVPWHERRHAHGPATDVPGQLAAVIVGDDDTRPEAWWNLWGNIHHQGSIYEATVPAVPILFAIAGWRAHPDRAQALQMLREIAAAEGVHVWRHGEDGELVTDDGEQRRLYPALRSALEAGAAPLLEGLADEPDDVHQALVELRAVL
jgi:hypothetical protein